MIYDIKLHILSPVHIGCDEAYTPFEFVIDSDRKTLINFSLWKFIESLNEKEWQELNKISEIKSLEAIVSLYRFYSNLKIKITKIKRAEIPIPSELSNRYREVKKLKNEREILREFNSFTIQRTFFNPYSETPIIPGSSVKGSLRTGYLEGLLRESKDKENLIKNVNPKRPEELEKKLLNGEFNTDPFRLLKVSDFEPDGEAKTKIIYQINVRKLNNRFREALSIPIEVIPEGTVFKGTIKLDTAIENSGIKKIIKLNDLLLKANHHYAGIFNGEINLHKSKGFRIPDVSRFREHLKNKYFIIRIGKHSGAESVTIEGLRQIKVRTREGIKIKDSSTTIWLASNEKRHANLSQTIPFGWVILEVENEHRV